MVLLRFELTTLFDTVAESLTQQSNVSSTIFPTISSPTSAANDVSSSIRNVETMTVNVVPSPLSVVLSGCDRLAALNANQSSTGRPVTIDLLQSTDPDNRDLP
eukprot:928571-Amorphochlora_amoeboformis.AAC.1